MPVSTRRPAGQTGRRRVAALLALALVVSLTPMTAAPPPAEAQTAPAWRAWDDLRETAVNTVTALHFPTEAGYERNRDRVAEWADGEVTAVMFSRLLELADREAAGEDLSAEDQGALDAFREAVRQRRIGAAEEATSLYETFLEFPCQFATPSGFAPYRPSVCFSPRAQQFRPASSYPPSFEQLVQWGHAKEFDDFYNSPESQELADAAAGSALLIGGIGAVAVGSAVAGAVASVTGFAAAVGAVIQPFSVVAGTAAAVGAASVAGTIGVVIIAAISLGFLFDQVATNAELPDRLAEHEQQARDTTPDLAAMADDEQGRLELWATFLAERRGWLESPAGGGALNLDLVGLADRPDQARFEVDGQPTSRIDVPSYPLRSGGVEPAKTVTLRDGWFLVTQEGRTRRQLSFTFPGEAPTGGLQEQRAALFKGEDGVQLFVAPTGDAVDGVDEVVDQLQLSDTFTVRGPGGGQVSIVQPPPPTATVAGGSEQELRDGPITVAQGQAVTFDASGYPDGTSVEWYVRSPEPAQLPGQSSSIVLVGGQGPTSEAASFTQGFDSPGTGTVELVARRDGATARTEVEVNVTSRPPTVADLTLQDGAFVPRFDDDVIDFDVSNEVQLRLEDVAPASDSWVDVAVDWGDGTSDLDRGYTGGTGGECSSGGCRTVSLPGPKPHPRDVTFQHQYVGPDRDVTITVTLTDGYGARTTRSYDLSLRDSTAPSVSITTPAGVVRAGEAVVFDYTVGDLAGRAFALPDEPKCGADGQLLSSSSSLEGGTFTCRFPNATADYDRRVEVTPVIGDVTVTGALDVNVETFEQAVEVDVVATSEGPVGDGEFVPTGETITIQGRVGPSSDASQTVTVDLGDGTTETTETATGDPNDGRFSVTHSYSSSGEYDVDLSIDLVDDTITTTQPVRVRDRPTVALALDDNEGAAPVTSTTVDEGTDLTFYYTIDDPNGDGAVPVIDGIDCGVDGELVSHDPDGDRFTCAFPNGTGFSTSVRMAVVSRGLSSLPTSVLVDVENVAPSIDTFSFSPALPAPGDTLVATGTFTDPGDDTHTVTVDWGDGTSSQVSGDLGRSWRLTREYRGPYTTSFDYRVVLSDGQDEVEAGQGARTAPPPPPQVDLSGPRNVVEGSVGTYVWEVDGEPYIADGARFEDYPLEAGFPSCGDDGVLVAGSIVEDAAAGSFQCRFDDGPATSEVAVQVQGSQPNAPSDVARLSVEVEDVPPEAVIVDVSPAAPPTGEEITLTGAHGDPGAGDRYTLTIDWGDGSDPEVQDDLGPGGIETRHTYDVRGTYTIAVTTAAGQQATTVEQTVVVGGGAPPPVEEPPEPGLLPGSTGELPLLDPCRDRPLSDLTAAALVDVTDVDPDGVHATSIALLRCTGVVDSDPDGTFRPSGQFTRGQVAALLVRTLGLDAADGSTGFSDVPPDGPYREEIAALVQAGIANGYADGTFRPSEEVTRGQVAALLVRALGLDAADGPTGFSDVPADGPYREEIAALVQAGVAEGYPDGTFRPGEAVTRGQVASFLSRALRFEERIEVQGG